MEKISILLADAEPDIQNILHSYFKAKYRLSFLTPLLLDDLFKEPYLNSSIAIIDSGFSDGRGLEALKNLKTVKPSLPIIFTTSQSTEEVCFDAFKSGARNCLKKPYILIELIQNIELILKSKKRERESRTNILLNKNDTGLKKRPTPEKDHPGIESAKKYIEKNFDKSFTLDDLAAEVCLSKFHLCRIFKIKENKSYSKYLNLVRIAKAKELLKNDYLSISEICYISGYKDLTYFGRVFKTLEDVTPSTYRKNLSS